MPTTKHRINMTIPDTLYQRILAYAEENGITAEATACLQLITVQLNAYERGKAMAQFLQNTDPQTLSAISSEGLNYITEHFKK